LILTKHIQYKQQGALTYCSKVKVDLDLGGG
jgi:hypothetical protein